MVRFDGYEFELFQAKSLDSTSSGVTEVSALHEDASGRLWIGGSYFLPMGLSVFDRSTEQFKQYRHDPDNANSLVNDGVLAIQSSSTEPGIVWISGRSGINNRRGGLSRMQIETNTFTNYLFDPSDPATLPHMASSLLEDHEGTIWSSFWGINRFDPRAASGGGQDSVSFTTFLPAPDVAYGDSDSGGNFIHNIYEAPSEPGVLWGGGARGLHRFDMTTQSFTTYFPYADNPRDERNYVYAVFEDRTRTLWIGTTGGLYIFNRSDERFSRFEHQPTVPIVRSISEDRFGILWISSEGELMKLEGRNNPFSVHEYNPDPPRLQVRGVYVDQEGLLWVGNRNDIKRINRTTGEITTYASIPDNPTSLAINMSMNFYEDKAGRFWVPGTLAGVLNQWDRQTGQAIHYMHDPEDSTSMSDGNENVVLEDRSGSFWVGNYGGGVNRMDRQTGHFTRYMNDQADPHSLVNDFVLRLYEDTANRLWVGTERGLSRFEPATGTFTSHNNDLLVRIMMIHEDRAGRFWIASASTGLHRFDPESGQVIETYTTKSGLASNTLYSLYEDLDGMLWMSTENGLSQFNPETRSFVNYTMRDGLPFSRFVEGAHHQTAEGELFFGGPQGVISFFPDQLERNLIAPEVVFTDFRIAGASAAILPDGPLEASISMTEVVRLPHEQNDLTFEYVGLHSINPQQNRYRYQLEGYDTDWIDAGTQRSARYPRLPPGDYMFRVNAASSDGVWNEEGATMRITITPPWWRTTLAYIVYALFLVGVLLGVVRLQRRRLIQRERERTRDRELAQVKEIEKAYTKLKSTQQQLIQSEKMASLGQLTAGIAHEIKNPLNFVNNFGQINEELANDLSEQLEINSDKINGAIKQELQDVIGSFKTNSRQIVKHGKRADQIVQSMMQHARQDEGDWYRVEVNPFVDECVTVSHHGFNARIPDLEVTIAREFDERVGTLEMAPKEMSRVLQNLLNNALEAVHEKAASVNGLYEPKVSVSTSKKEDGVEVLVCDNGLGISDKIKNRIFEPFFTTKPTGSGTGLGLSLSYDIVVKGHSGSLTVESTEGEGATFVITLPIKGG